MALDNPIPTRNNYNSVWGNPNPNSGWGNNIPNVRPTSRNFQNQNQNHDHGNNQNDNGLSNFM